jgi:hypothetical protein
MTSTLCTAHGVREPGCGGVVSIGVMAHRLHSQEPRLSNEARLFAAKQRPPAAAAPRLGIVPHLRMA